MPITPEERARIARDNGAKSKGPGTPGGKYAETLAALLPPDEAVIALDDRREFVVLVHELMS